MLVTIPSGQRAQSAPRARRSRCGPRERRSPPARVGDAPRVLLERGSRRCHRARRHGGDGLRRGLRDHPASADAAITLLEEAIALDAGVGLDPGAIGKGLAGDIVSAEIAASGAQAVLVSIGGDVVTRGTPPDLGEWRISLRDDRTDAREEFAVITLSGDQRAVATSSRLRRRWAARHHILDPFTGSPVEGDVVQATVIADSGWRSEAGATLALVRGSASASWLAEHGCTAYLLAEDHVHA